jgi:hypothetical protein
MKAFNGSNNENKSLSRRAIASADVIRRLPGAIQKFVNTTATFQATVAEVLGLNVVALFALQALSDGKAETPI